MFSLQLWDEFHLRTCSRLRGELPQRHVQFNVECDLVRYENKVETTMRIRLQNFQGENNFKGVQKSS